MSLTKAYKEALRAALRKEPALMDAIARVLFREAMKGDLRAIKEIRETLEGKKKPARKRRAKK